ncbi:MAG: stage II sporulation protein M, partial [Flavobacteriales bacterium]|nr:stage II sporulation protein M [Flavobacteriales bacterium]
MKESSFIRQNKEKWQEFEQAIASKDKNPKLISRLFIQITDDLSFSRTFYKNRSVKAYLNGTAQVLFEDIYKSEKMGVKGFFKFWKQDLPVIIYESRFDFLISLAVLIFSLTIGVVSSIQNPDFAREILGDGYVNMTLENIEKGDPMAVYKGFNEVEGFLAITANNLMVDVITFLTGIFFGLGSIISIIRNGVMVGCFQYFFVQKGLFWESFLTIFQHGTLEVSTMVISGAAGIALGRGLMFPGTYTRLQAFRISALRGLKIFFGVLPITIVAGFIEGFITRHTETPDIIRIIVILASLAFIIFYYIVYPYFLYVKKGLRTKRTSLKFRDKKPFNQTKIYNSSEILGFALSILLKYKSLLLKIIGLTTILYGAGLSLKFLYVSQDSENYFTEYFWDDFLELLGFAQNPVLLGISILLHFIVLSSTLYTLRSWIMHTAINMKGYFSFISANILTLFITVFIYQGLLFINSGFIMFLTYLSLPFLLLGAYSAITNGNFLFKGIGNGFSILKNSTGNLILI